MECLFHCFDVSGISNLAGLIFFPPIQRPTAYCIIGNEKVLLLWYPVSIVWSTPSDSGYHTNWPLSLHTAPVSCEQICRGSFFPSVIAYLLYSSGAFLLPKT